MSEKILDIKDERLSFFTPAGEVKALNGVSFTMNQGDVLGVQSLLFPLLKNCFYN